MSKKILVALVIVLAIINVFAFRQVLALAGPQYLQVEALDIGQGDAIFIKTSARRTILIDGGPDSAVLTKLAARLPFWQRTLDAIILTHPDADHVMGLLEVLKKYQVDYIVWTGMMRNNANYDQWLSLLKKAKQQGTQIIIAHQGTKINSAGAVLEVLHPFENVEGKFFKESNDTGIVLRLDYGTASFLFTADISSKIEGQLVTTGAPLAIDVLKVAHHGSKYSTSEIFLEAAHPQFAVISAGKDNSYGHPTPEVLQRLEEFGITVLRTDQQGDVTFLSDGNHIQVKN